MLDGLNPGDKQSRDNGRGDDAQLRFSQNPTVQALLTAVAGQASRSIANRYLRILDELASGKKGNLLYSTGPENRGLHLEEPSIGSALVLAANRHIRTNVQLQEFLLTTAVEACSAGVDAAAFLPKALRDNIRDQVWERHGAVRLRAACQAAQFGEFKVTQEYLEGLTITGDDRAKLKQAGALGLAWFCDSIPTRNSWTFCGSSIMRFGRFADQASLAESDCLRPSSSKQMDERAENLASIFEALYLEPMRALGLVECFKNDEVRAAYGRAKGRSHMSVLWVGFLEKAILPRLS